MSEDYIQLPDDSTGKKLRTYKHTVGANEVHEETMQVTDGTGTVVDPRSIRALTATDVVTETNSAAIHDAIRSELFSAPQGKKISKFEFSWSGDNLSIIKAYDNVELLFTLAFTWSAGNLESISRS